MRNTLKDLILTLKLHVYSATFVYVDDKSDLPAKEEALKMIKTIISEISILETIDMWNQDDRVRQELKGYQWYLSNIAKNSSFYESIYSGIVSSVNQILAEK